LFKEIRKYEPVMRRYGGHSLTNEYVAIMMREPSGSTRIKASNAAVVTSFNRQLTTKIRQKLAATHAK
jgi:hypothetical protein